MSLLVWWWPSWQLIRLSSFCGWISRLIIECVLAPIFYVTQHLRDFLFDIRIVVSLEPHNLLHLPLLEGLKRILIVGVVLVREVASNFAVFHRALQLILAKFRLQSQF